MANCLPLMQAASEDRFDSVSSPPLLLTPACLLSGACITPAGCCMAAAARRAAQQGRPCSQLPWSALELALAGVNVLTLFVCRPPTHPPHPHLPTHDACSLRSSPWWTTMAHTTSKPCGTAASVSDTRTLLHGQIGTAHPASAQSAAPLPAVAGEPGPAAGWRMRARLAHARPVDPLRPPLQCSAPPLPCCPIRCLPHPPGPKPTYPPTHPPSSPHLQPLSSTS